MPQQLPILAEERATCTTQRSDADRAAAIERLRAKLADPTFRQIEGFPSGDDDAILALSDPTLLYCLPKPLPVSDRRPLVGGAATAENITRWGQGVLGRKAERCYNHLA